MNEEMEYDWWNYMPDVETWLGDVERRNRIWGEELKVARKFITEEENARIKEESSHEEGYEEAKCVERHSVCDEIGEKDLC